MTPLAGPLAGMDLEALEEVLLPLGEARFRARQVFQAVQRGGHLAPGDLPSVPARLRATLAERIAPPATRLAEEQHGRDGTRKILLSLADGRSVESVAIAERGRLTVCLSTQVGCPIRCVFCASGVGGLVRNLTPAEILEPLLHFLRLLQRRPGHLVFMGMGEPLLNLRSLLPVLRLLLHPTGLRYSPRRITVSTAGVPAGIDRLGQADLGVGLAISLHAADDETRARLVPGSPPGRTQALVEAAAAYARRSGRDATIEYVLISGENDRPQDAEHLAQLVANRHLHVNLIPLNPVRHRPDLRAPSGIAARAFLRRLRQGGAHASLRTRHGSDIDAACGQLALERTLEARAVAASGLETPRR